MWITDAYAQGAPGGGPFGSDGISTLVIIGMFVLMYFVMLRPQLKRQKETQAMLAGLQKGDEVVAAGLLGRIVEINDSVVHLEIARNTVVQVQKLAVSTLLPKGTMK